MPTNTIWLGVAILVGLLASGAGIIVLVAIAAVPIATGLILLAMLDAVIIVGGYMAVRRSLSGTRLDQLRRPKPTSGP
jgi:hypothetical protein